jgi:CHAT domain-containing protein/tetratricopeptide (TPR) repeat protein
LGSFLSNAQTDFPALKQQFLDYRKADQQDSALYIARKMNQLALKEQSDTSYWYALSMRYQGNPHDTWGNTDSTLFFWKKSAELFEKYHPESPDYAASINNLVFLYYRLGDYKASEPIYKQAIEIQKKILGENNPDYALRLYNIGNLFYLIGDYQLAESSLKQSLEIRKKVLGEEHPDVAICLNSLGNLYSTLDNYIAAISVYEHYLEIKKKTVGEDHPDFASALDKLSDIHIDIGNYKAAETDLKKSLEIRKRTLGEEHSDVAISLQHLGKLYSIELNDYKSAEPLLKQSLEIRKRALGEEHSDFAESLNDLGLLYYSMGDYKSAEPLFKEALEIIKKSQGDEEINFTSPLSCLGALYTAMCDYKSAERIYKQALDILNKGLNEDHPLLSFFLEYLGKVYANKGDYEAAETYFKQSLEIRKKAFGDEHGDVASSLMSLGTLNEKMGDNKKAEELYKQALEIQKNVLGKEHSDIAMCLNKLAYLYYQIGDYKTAEPLYEQTLEVLKNALGENHPSYIYNENWLAYLYTRTNREQQAYQILNKNVAKKSEEVAKNFEWLSDNQKEVYWNQEIVFYDNLSWYASLSCSKVPESVSLNYNAALLTKSKMLETKISSENYYREVDELREELAYRRRLLAKMESDGSTEKDRIDKLRKEADSLDKRLTLSWPEYAQQKKNLSITWNQVQQNLYQGEAAIEFVRFKNEDDSLYYYNALVLKKGDSNPTLIKLCKEEDLTAITPKMGFSAYYPLIWQPLESALNGIKTIYYAPTGELYNVPFHALYAPKGKGDEVLAAKTDKRGAVIQNEKATTEQNAEYLMDRYTLHQLTSTRYLAMGLKQIEKEKIGNNIAMVGGVNYDYLPGSQSSTTKTKKNKNASRSSQSASGKLAYLEGTKTEVEQIASSVTPNNWQATLLENNDATEEKIIKLENKEAKSILHIATHGFAFPEYDFNDTTISTNSLRYSYRYSTNPMVRSGLILAGGNWAWTGSDTLTKLGAEQNGILTALEVSQLNLKKTKLVVLSACETGLGKIEGSEGTFGLKRGFKLAGVEQMIVSLWSVPDKETMELMTLFYSDLTKTLDPVVSFEKAQREMRMRYPTEPEKWAGFVLVR